MVAAVETVLEYQDKATDQAGAAGDEGQDVPFTEQHPLFSQVETTDEDLDEEEDDERHAGNDEVPVVKDVVIVLEVCPVDHDEADPNPQGDEEIAGDT